MKLSFKKIILIGLISSLFMVDVSMAAVGDKADKFGLDTTADYAQVKGLAISQQSSPLDIAAKYISLGLSFLGVVFFLFILYAGVKWMTALGSSERVEKAKDLLETALIGLIITLAAYGISTFLFKSFAKFTSSGGSSAAKVDCTKKENEGQICGVVGDNSICYKSECVSACYALFKKSGSTASCKVATVGCDSSENKSSETNLCPTGKICCHK